MKNVSGLMSSSARALTMTSGCRTVQCRFASGLVFALGNISQAVVYDCENDFSTTVNTESSIWSYRWQDSFTRDGVFPLLPVFRMTWASMPYFPTWGPGPIDSQAYPMIGVNDSGGPIYDPVLDPGGLWPWPNGQSDLIQGRLMALDRTPLRSRAGDRR